MAKPDWKGKWAVVTGASAGIGLELAAQLAAMGTNLVITARRRDRLEAAAADLRARHGVEVEIVTADLNDPAAPDWIFSYTRDRGIAVELLINNAGFGLYGEFHRNDPVREVGMVRVNCVAVVHLTRLFLPAMVERRSGGVLIVSSTAAFQAVPYIATYAATKGFDLMFAEAVAAEVKRYGVHVCALCPGPTESEFVEVAGAPEPPRARVASAASVASLGLRALAEGRPAVVHGTANRAGIVLQRMASRRLVTRAAGRMFRPKDLR